MVVVCFMVMAVMKEYAVVKEVCQTVFFGGGLDVVDDRREAKVTGE